MRRRARKRLRKLWLLLLLLLLFMYATTLRDQGLKVTLSRVHVFSKKKDQNKEQRTTRTNTQIKK